MNIESTRDNQLCTVLMVRSTAAQYSALLRVVLVCKAIENEWLRWQPSNLGEHGGDSGLGFGWCAEASAHSAPFDVCRELGAVQLQCMTRMTQQVM